MKLLLQKKLVLGNYISRKTSRMFAPMEGQGIIRIKVRILVAIWHSFYKRMFILKGNCHAVMLGDEQRNSARPIP